MKLAVSSYSFAALGLGDKECIRLAADMGFDAIEFAEVNVNIRKSSVCR